MNLDEKQLAIILEALSKAISSGKYSYDEVIEMQRIINRIDKHLSEDKSKDA
jgi:hypothetical protein